MDEHRHVSVRRTDAGLELADVFRAHGDRLPALTPEHAKVVRAIASCRTAVLGGHLEECDHCGYPRNAYNSCRDRHCPKCQRLSQARWLEARKDELLPVGCFHVVFTIPRELHPLFRAAPRVAYNQLFAAVAETLKEVALNPNRLGAKIGFTAVLHTWTQTLLFHPHLHCIVPGGGLAPDDSRWISSRTNFFLPVKVLATVFRAKLLHGLEGALDDGDIPVCPSDAKPLLSKAAKKGWVVYSKRPFAGPQQVLDYLARYTHRIAISNDRLLSMEGDQVTLSYRDRADDNRKKTLSIGAVELLRRFLLHVVPIGFLRIRHYGFLANAVKKTSLPLCRKLLGDCNIGDDEASENGARETWQELLLRLTGKDPTLCPRCNIGHLVRVRHLAPVASPWCLPGRASSP